MNISVRAELWQQHSWFHAPPILKVNSKSVLQLWFKLFSWRREHNTFKCLSYLCIPAQWEPRLYKQSPGMCGCCWGLISESLKVSSFCRHTFDATVALSWQDESTVLSKLQPPMEEFELLGFVIWSAVDGLSCLTFARHQLWPAGLTVNSRAEYLLAFGTGYESQWSS